MEFYSSENISKVAERIITKTNFSALVYFMMFLLENTFKGELVVLNPRTYIILLMNVLNI